MVPGVDGDPELLKQLIDTMESILEVFPEDVSALESLAAAYQQAGEMQKSADTAIRLARLIQAQGNLEKAFGIVEHVLKIAPEHNAAMTERERIVQSLTMLGIDIGTLKKTFHPDDKTGESPEEESADRDILNLDLSGELELGWFLLQKGMLTQEQYETAIAGLTESRSNVGSSSCLSLLIEIAAMDGVNVDNIIGELSFETSTPYVDLGRFELKPKIVKRVPFDDARRLGVLPFERLKNDYMVATLNPVDKHLRAAISTFLNAKTHFFLASPEQFQSALMEVMTMTEEEE